MIASSFTPPAHPAFPSWVRHTAYAGLCAVGVPIAKSLELMGLWPKVVIRRLKKKASGFGGYEPSTSDIFACAGFKSGTTWLLQILVQTAYRGAAEFENIHSVVPWPDAPTPIIPFVIPLADGSPVKCSPTALRVIKTHLPQQRVPWSAQARYVALVRDPKDVMVSGYHFLRALLFGPLMPSIDHWIDLNLAAELPHGSWAQHVASYWRVRKEPNVLFLTYEDMLRDPRAAVVEIARFMQVELNAAELEAVVLASSFAGMQKSHSKFDPGRIVPWGGERFMIRRGRSGGSSELLTPQIQRRIDDHYRAELLSLGCDFPYDETFGNTAEHAHSAIALRA